MPEFLCKERIGDWKPDIKLPPNLLLSLEFIGDVSSPKYLNLNGRLRLVLARGAKNEEWMLADHQLGFLLLGEINDQCGALVLSHLDVLRDPTPKETKLAMFEAAVQVAKKCGFYTLLATTYESTDFLKDFGFKPLEIFKNRRTGYNCRLWIYKIPINESK